MPGFVVYLMVNTCPKVGLSGVKSSALITGTKTSIGGLSEKTHLRVNKKSYFLGLGCLGFGHVASLS